MLKADLSEVIEMAEEFGGHLEERMEAIKAHQWKIQQAVEGVDVMEVVGAAMQIVLLGAEQMAVASLDRVNEDDPDRDWTKDDLFKMYVASLGLMMVNTAENGRVEEVEH